MISGNVVDDNGNEYANTRGDYDHVVKSCSKIVDISSSSSSDSDPIRHDRSKNDDNIKYNDYKQQVHTDSWYDHLKDIVDIEKQLQQQQQKHDNFTETNNDWIYYKDDDDNFTVKNALPQHQRRMRRRNVTTLIVSLFIVVVVRVATLVDRFVSMYVDRSDNRDDVNNAITISTVNPQMMTLGQSQNNMDSMPIQLVDVDYSGGSSYIQSVAHRELRIQQDIKREDNFNHALLQRFLKSSKSSKSSSNRRRRSSSRSQSKSKSQRSKSSKSTKKQKSSSSSSSGKSSKSSSNSSSKSTKENSNEVSSIGAGPGNQSSPSTNAPTPVPTEAAATRIKNNNNNSIVSGIGVDDAMMIGTAKISTESELESYSSQSVISGIGVGTQEGSIMIVSSTIPSDMPSQIPSDVPSLVPSDVPSTPPSMMNRTDNIFNNSQQ